MRTVVTVGLLAVACGRSAPAPEATPAPATPLDEAPSEPPPPVSADPPADDATTTAAEPEPAPPPAPAVTAERSTARALVLADGELRRLAASGKTELVTAAPGMVGCDVDDAHGVVWLASARDLAAYDLAEGVVHPVTKGAVVLDDYGLSWRVQHADGASPLPIEVAGNADGLNDCVALVLDVDVPPRVRGGIVAEGDREWYCFQDDGEGGFVEGKLNDDELQRKRGYDRAKLVDAKLVAALAAGPTPPTAPRVKVDVDRCTEEAEACGRAEYVGGERLWWIVVGNSRGDFFHEERMLYDAKTRTWWDPLTDRRASKPREGYEGVGIHASPDRSWGLIADKILSLGDAKVTGSWTGTFCGWQR